MDFTVEQLQAILPNSKNIGEWYDALEKAFPKYDITTTVRVAAFLAQCGHESAGFTTLKENLNYRPSVLVKVFPKYFPTLEIANEYCARSDKQQAIANRVYANRMGNGNEQSGDGYKFAGGGLIQLTGKNNYTAFANSIGRPVNETIDYVKTPDGAVESACWFWKTNHLNEIADREDMVTLTRRINGGTNGLEDRIKHYHHAKEVLEQG